MSFPPGADDFAGAGSLSRRSAASTVWPSLVVALLTTLGSLWLSVGMGLKACPLCFYQRTFAMGVLGVLSVGVLEARRYRGTLNLLVLPLAVAGFGVAAFHEYLEVAGKLECPTGVFGVGTAAQQSLFAFVLLLVVVATGVVRDRAVGDLWSMAAAGGVVVGLLLAAGSVVSAPPMPPSPTKAYEAVPDVCRPPFRPQ